LIVERPYHDGVNLEEATAVFTSVRPRLFGIAYRMLSSVAEAEDLVQDAWLRWQTCDRDAVVNPAAFLATTTTRLAINALQSARVRRETYIGPWLPEPVDTSADPYLGAERDSALQFAALLLMEKLTPSERAAYVLREAFDYPYQQIAEILQSSETAVRQLVSRARKHMTGERRAPVNAGMQRTMLTTFVAACRTGDLMDLAGFLESATVPSTFITRSLKNHFPLTEGMRATASGMIALQVERDPATFVFFFRPEVAQTVLWGGNPEKPVVPSDDGFRLGPRKSFEIWKEEVQGQSLPWTKHEVRVAQELRSLITVVAYGR